MGPKLELVGSEAALTPWQRLKREAQDTALAEPSLASLLNAVILCHDDLGSALSFQLARKLGDGELSAMTLREIATQAYAEDGRLVVVAECDLMAVFARDAATSGLLQPFLFFKGYLSIQTQRIAHQLWNSGRRTLALYLQSRMSELFQVDIHPAARLGRGVFIDHGTGVVVGETAIIGDDVSILQGVTLGGTGAESGDRHPKIGQGVLLGAGAKVLGNITVGNYAKVAAGSVVLRPVPPRTTVAGVPARVVRDLCAENPAACMDQGLHDPEFDYVI